MRDEDGIPAGGDSSQTQRGWRGCRAYVVARLPRLQSLDGKEIKRSERILAVRQLPALTAELRVLATARKQEQRAEGRRTPSGAGDTEDAESADGGYIADDAPTHHDPDTRTKMSNELHDQKAAKERQEKANQPPKPKGEGEWADEHREAVRKTREREGRAQGGEGYRDAAPGGGDGPRGDCRVKQCNRGKYQFWFEEETPRDGHDKAVLVLRVALPKHLATSLIDVDVHPTYVSVVIKSKVLRVVLPVEVQSDRSVARRSTASGHLELTMPKVNPDEVVIGLGHVREKGRTGKTPADQNSQWGREADAKQKREHLGQSILKDAGKIDSLRIIHNEESEEKKNIISSTCDDDEDEPPPLH